MNNKSKNIILQYTLYGVLFGIIIRLVSIVMDMSFRSLPISLDSLIKIHDESSVNYFLDFFPIILTTIFGYILGVVIYKTKVKATETIEKNETRLTTIYDFIEKLRLGKIDFEVKFEDQDDELENSLINLRAELEKQKEEEEKRKQEDRQRNWTSEGLAEFGAILRETSENLDELSNKILSRLVRYVNSEQAGFFIINDTNKEDKHIEQIASFAYGRKKFAEKKIEWGEGLVGACILEKETIFIKKVSDSYLEITSGLGKANPRSILIVPLKTEEGVIHGAIEIASFNVYKKFEVEFVESVAESIATTITSLKNKMQTENLLLESRNQAKQFAEQEEKMRNTLENMKELQIEAAKQNEEFVSFTNSVNHTMIRAEYGIDGILKYANTKFLNILGYESNFDVEGKHITDFINKKDRGWFDKIWKRLTSGGKHFEGDMKHVAKDGKDVWTISTYVSVRDIDGNPSKILFLGIDTTSEKGKSLDYEGQINALNYSSLKAEFLPSGEVIEFNKKYLELLSMTPEEVIGRIIFDIIPEEQVSAFKDIWKKIEKGIPSEGRYKMIDSSGKEVWLYGTYSVVRNMYEEIAKIIFIGNDITKQHLIELEIKEQTKQLKEQELKLQESKVQLSKKLKQSREEMKQQFREIETVKLLHDKALEGMLDVIITINQDNNIEFFNKAAEELWGIKKQEILGKNIKELLPDKHKELAGEYLGDYFNVNNKTITVNTRTEVYIVDKNNEQVFVLMTLSEAGIGLRYNLTAFIQQIEVELF